MAILDHSLVDKIREMVKFDGIDQPVAQLKEDEAVLNKTGTRGLWNP